MKKIYGLTILIFTILLAACTWPFGDPEQSIPENGLVENPKITATLTPQPSPTPSPTPIPEVRISLAEKSLFEGNYNAALTELEQAKINATESNILAEVDIRIAQVYIIQARYSEAVSLLRPIVDNEALDNDVRAKANYFYGSTQENLNNPVESARGYVGYSESAPGKLDSFMLEKAGDVLSQSQMLDEALEKYNVALEQVNNQDNITIKIKIGRIFAAQLDHTNAIRVFMEVHAASPNEYVRAQMNLLAGQSYLALGLPDQAYARFQDSVQNYPRAFDSHSGLVALVNAGIPVDEFNRGLTNYYAGSHGLAINAFLRFMEQTPDHDGTSLYFIGHAYQRMDDPTNALLYWEKLINNYPNNIFFVDAWKDIAYTQWAFQNLYSKAAQTLLTFAKTYPANEYAPEAIMEAGRIYERNNQLTDAAQTWSGLIDLYPQLDISSQALFLSGITNYRLSNLDQALSQIQRYLLLTAIPEEKASAFFWIGKIHEKNGDSEKAKSAWQEASIQDPTGYYTERAKEKLSGSPLYTPSQNVNLDINLEQERLIAEVWMRNTFSLPNDTNFITLAPFADDINFIKAIAFWDLGLYQSARNEYEALRELYKNDPVNLFRLTNHFVDIGLYRSAIYSSRQILDLANMDDFGSLNAPLWFNHIRFGLYFRDIIEQAAEEYNFDPLLVFSLIRQESFFEGFIISSAGAKGLMQIMPATGEEISKTLNWPVEYQESDLYRPIINIRMGTSYLSRMRTFFDDDIYAALAAYNAGPGNVLKWIEKANNDQDLFLEIIPFEETRRYLRNIYTFYRIYESLYPVRTVQ
jgi:soluble lytic murein transglycosylase